MMSSVVGGMVENSKIAQDRSSLVTGALQMEGAGLSGNEASWVYGETSMTDFEKIAFYGGACLVY